MPVALVTGGNRGIGFEVCRRLGRLGYAVLLGARDLAKGEEAAALLNREGLNASALELDVANEENVARLGELERVDALINNAAIAPDRAHPDTSALHVPAELVRLGFETNTLGPYRICQQVVPIMQHHGYGRIVNVASGMAQLSEMNGHSPGYRLSKTALNALTRILADGSQGLRNSSYQLICFFSLKKPPVGPTSGSVAAQTIVSAPCSGVSGAAGPPISVLTQPGSTELTRMFIPFSSSARMRVSAFSAVLDSR